MTQPKDECREALLNLSQRLAEFKKNCICLNSGNNATILYYIAKEQEALLRECAMFMTSERLYDKLKAAGYL